MAHQTSKNIPKQLPPNLIGRSMDADSSSPFGSPPFRGRAVHVAIWGYQDRQLMSVLLVKFDYLCFRRAAHR